MLIRIISDQPQITPRRRTIPMDNAMTGCRNCNIFNYKMLILSAVAVADSIADAEVGVEVGSGKG